MAISLLQSHLQKKSDLCLSAHGISFTELMVLYHLDKAPDKTMRRIDLAECVGLSASGITRLLKPMEKIKLIQKEENPRDARVSLVKLSTSGERVFKEAYVSFQERADELLGALDTEERLHFLALTYKVIP